MLTDKDCNQIAELGISEAQLDVQLSNFREGFPVLNIERAATIGDGIMQLSREDVDSYRAQWEEGLERGNYSVLKFVPASGASTRMFKSLYEYINGNNSKDAEDFLRDIEKYAFYADLDDKCKVMYGYDISRLVGGDRGRDVARALLNEEGLNYGSLPKGLLKFHKYGNGEIRTPFMEHMEEGARYGRNKEGMVRLHFTISPDHREAFVKHLDEQRGGYEDKYGVRYDVEFSVQAECTNTVAVREDNSLYRDGNGNLVFRPAGHGALIKNLNEVDADIVFVKNIDNVTVDKRVETTVEYKAALGALALEYQAKVFDYLRKMDEGECDEESVGRFVREELNVECGEGCGLDSYRMILNRPLRVCGMVRNEGEPGGGPFLVRDGEGMVTLQILESSQISERDMHKMKEASHFNPVDLVCAVKDYKGNKFDLMEYVDHETGFISHKSIEGETIKALELPGLWNGAMSRWNTVFVEVPVETFNPVKTVADLTRLAHMVDV